MSWYTIALVSALLSALAAILEKKILFKEKAIEFTFVLSIMNALIASIFLFFTDFSKISSATLLVLGIKAIIGSAAFLCIMHSIKNLELSKALPILALTPGLVAILELIILKQTFTSIQIFGMACLLIGIFIIKEGKEHILEPFQRLIHAKGHWYVVSALLLLSIAAILDKTILKGYNMPLPAFMGIQHWFFAIFFLAIFLFTRTRKHGLSKSTSFIKETLKKSWIWILILSIITLLYRWAEVAAVKDAASIAMVLTIKRTSVFFAVIAGGTLFKERNLLRRSIATLMVVIGAILLIP
jgi:drug/metabolite transporter (DMT)-like permease